MNYARFDDARDHCADERDGKGVVDVELERGRAIVLAVVREDVQECADEVERLASDIRDLKYWTYPLRNELSLEQSG